MNKELKFSVDSKIFSTEKQFLKGEEIKKMAGIELNDELYLVIPSYEDELIENDKIVNMARPGIERFLSRKTNKVTTLIINGQLKEYNGAKIPFVQVVKLAFGEKPLANEMGYTVTYSDGPQQNPEGIMSKGDTVFVKHNMVFNVTATHKS